MGTRGAVGFRSNRQDKVQYNHFDSYPSGLGSEVLTFISSSTIEELKQISSRIILVDEEKKPTDKQVEECAKWTNLSVSNQSTDDWYCLLRNAQGNLEAYREGLPYMLNANNFLLDSLFCEYAYIINTDNNTLEFYSGFNQTLFKNKGRYAKKKDPNSTRDNGYYGVALIGKYPLEEIIGADSDKIRKIIEKMDKQVKRFRKYDKDEN